MLTFQYLCFLLCYTTAVWYVLGYAKIRFNKLLFTIYMYRSYDHGLGFNIQSMWEDLIQSLAELCGPIKKSCPSHLDVSPQASSAAPWKSHNIGRKSHKFDSIKKQNGKTLTWLLSWSTILPPSLFGFHFPREFLKRSSGKFDLVKRISGYR